MSKTVVGVFPDYSRAEEVARELEGQGYSRSDISVVASDHKGDYSNAAMGDGSVAASGAGTGAAIGGAAGLALGLVALAIPGIGPIIALGPLATALTGAGIGAAAGGLIGAMTAMGVPEEDAHHYSGLVKEGQALLMVSTTDVRADSAVAMLERFGAESVDERDGNSTASAKKTPAGVRVYPHSGYQQDTKEMYRNHYRDNYESKGKPYDAYAPGYQYGSELANDSRYAGREWNDVESSARSNWEQRGEGAWESMQDSIRHGWDKVRSKV